MASFSGRACDIDGAWNTSCMFARSTVILPRQHGVIRVACRPRSLVCNAIALRNYLDISVFKNLLKVLRIPQEESVSEFTAHSDHESDELARRLPRSKSFSNAVRDATLTAVHVGLSLTGAALHLASKVVAGLQHRAELLSQRNAKEKEAAAARQEVADAQARIEYEIQRQQLEKQGKDAAFVKMLHVLDRCHLDHDVKWALVQKHTADKAEFSERLSQLYKLAQDSKDAVDHLLRPEATRKEINTFWKSPETVAIIAEEDKLKSLVFAQMLQASSS